MKPIFSKLKTFCLWLAIPGLGGAITVGASFYLYLSPKLPPVETLKAVKLQTPLRIYSQDSQLIGEFGEKRRSPISFEDIPPRFISALLAAEDDGFYDHFGVDFKGLLRAASELISTGHIQTGGSTITMQVARNFFLSAEQKFIRKFNEILLALRIEEELSKQEILTLYANKVYLGNRAYGIEAAAQVYYGTSIGELDLPQLAMIAGLPKAPSAYNPLVNPERAIARRNWIIRRMFKLGHIGRGELDEALAAPVTASYHGQQVAVDAPYAAELARQEAVQLLGLNAYTDGYRVFTTIDSKEQQNASSAVRKGLLTYDWRHGYRGPEQKLADPEEWEQALADTPTYGDLVPGIVTAVSDSSLELIIKGEPSTVTLEWQDNLENLRRHITANRRTAPISKAGELFEPGDLIRVRRDGATGRWQLSQLPKAQAALVALNPENGAIRALVGGFDFNQSHFNRITQARRQPGSNFKPFIYTRALESGMTPASIINDAPVVFDDPSLEKTWRPENDSGKFYGPTRLRRALYLSRNLVSIRILRGLGVGTAIEGMSRFGFEENSLPRNLSLALGSHALTPLEIATGYATFANGGYKVSPFLVSRVEGPDSEEVFRARPETVCRDCTDEPEQHDTPGDEGPGGESLEPDSLEQLLAEDNDRAETTPVPHETDTILAPALPEETPLPKARQILDPRIAFTVDSMLKDVIRKGTGTKARALKRSDIAGKTGTTNGPRDAWFSGYSPHLVATVWVGFDENLPLGRNEYGGSAALPIWIDFMAEALAGKPEIIRPQPQGLVSVRIDKNTGERVGPGHPNAMFEIFLEENVPAPGQASTLPELGSDQPPLPEELF